MPKGPEAFRTISEAATEVGVPQHVLRFWETKFAFVRPMKGAGGRRFYRRQDIDVLLAVRGLLHEQGCSIKTVQALHKDHGVRGLFSPDLSAPRQSQQARRTPPSPALALQPVGATSAGLAAAGGLGADASRRLWGVLVDLETVKAKLDDLLPPLFKR